MVAAGEAALLLPPVGAQVHRPMDVAGAERPVVMAQELRTLSARGGRPELC